MGKIIEVKIYTEVDEKFHLIQLPSNEVYTFSNIVMFLNRVCGTTYDEKHVILIEVRNLGVGD